MRSLLLVHIMPAEHEAAAVIYMQRWRSLETTCRWTFSPLASLDAVAYELQFLSGIESH